MTVKRKTTRTKKEKPKIKRVSTKITKKQKASVTVREDKNLPYKKGDYCFYLNRYNKTLFAEVYSAHKNKDGHYYVLVEQRDCKFVTVEHKWCADDDKAFKGIKRK
jgi:hypothetical protein